MLRQRVESHIFILKVNVGVQRTPQMNWAELRPPHKTPKPNPAHKQCLQEAGAGFRKNKQGGCWRGKEKKKNKKKKSCEFRDCLQLIFCPPCRSLPHLACGRAGQTLTPVSARESKATPCPWCQQPPGFHPTGLGSTCCCCAASLLGKCRAPAQGSALFLFPKRLVSAPMSPDLLPSWAQLPASLPKSPSHTQYLTTSMQEDLLEVGSQPVSAREPGLLQVGVWLLVSKESLLRPKLALCCIRRTLPAHKLLWWGCR